MCCCLKTSWSTFPVQPRLILSHRLAQFVALGGRCYAGRTFLLPLNIVVMVTPFWRCCSTLIASFPCAAGSPNSLEWPSFWQSFKLFTLFLEFFFFSFFKRGLNISVWPTPAIYRAIHLHAALRAFWSIHTRRRRNGLSSDHAAGVTLKLRPHATFEMLGTPTGHISMPEQ